MAITSESILFVYLFVFAISLIVEVWLQGLNISHVQSNAEAVPEAFRAEVDLDTYRRSVEYTLAKAKFALVSGIYSSVFVLLMILTGLMGALDVFVSIFVSDKYVWGILYVLLIGLIFTLVGLPFSLYSTFVLEEKFGFNKSSFGLWVLDLVKSLLISALIAVVLLCGIFYFMEKSASLWWLYAFLFIAIFQLFLMFVYPVWIAPLFNKFTPLPEGQLRDAILKLADELNFKTAGVFVMDGSRRSGHGNAYFTGFGANKRVVLFDTLIKSLKQEELLAVLAHEIGHEKNNHIKKGFALSLLFTLAGFYILSLLMSYAPFYSAFGFSAPSYHAALVIFVFASGPFTFFLSPLFNMLSRRFEFQADAFSVKAMNGWAALCAALLALSRDNLSNFTPHPWYSFFHYSHPTLAERLDRMRKL